LGRQPPQKGLSLVSGASELGNSALVSHGW
jgi:hypothetical protein